MKTYWKAGEGGSKLPPPLAPVAKDANPWAMPEQLGDRPARRPQPATLARPRPKAPLGADGSSIRRPPQELWGPQSRPTAPPGAAAPVPPQPAQPPPLQSPGRGREISRGVPLLFILGAMIAAIVAARRAIATGDFAGAIGPLLVVGFIAFSWWRRSRRR